jgi:hypothetical protein
MDVKMVIDCSAAGAAVLMEEAAGWDAAAQAADDAGDVITAAQRRAQAERLRGQAHVEGGGRDLITMQPLTDDEQRQRVVDAELAAAAAVEQRRAERNALLAASDWTQVADVPLTAEQRAAWAKYRQQLRDLTFGTDEQWPVAPA